jgi:hypothetical protein
VVISSKIVRRNKEKYLAAACNLEGIILKIRLIICMPYKKLEIEDTKT